MLCILATKSGRDKRYYVPPPLKLGPCMWTWTMKPGKVLLGNTVALTLTKTEGVHCGSAANGLCIMNTFFQHKRIHKHTPHKNSRGQRSLIDFCIISADLFCAMSDVRVERRAELSTDHHLVVCTLKASKLSRKRKTFTAKKLSKLSNFCKWESLVEILFSVLWVIF